MCGSKPTGSCAQAATKVPPAFWARAMPLTVSVSASKGALKSLRTGFDERAGDLARLPPRGPRRLLSDSIVSPKRLEAACLQRFAAPSGCLRVGSGNTDCQTAEATGNLGFM